MAATVVTLNDLEGRLSLAGLFRCNLSKISTAFYTISTDSVLARFLCISRASCCTRAHPEDEIHERDVTYIVLYDYLGYLPLYHTPALPVRTIFLRPLYVLCTMDVGLRKAPCVYLRVISTFRISSINYIILSVVSRLEMGRYIENV